MSPTEGLKAENARLAARVAELEAQLARAPMDRPSLYRMTDSAPWGALVSDRDGRLDYANPAFQRWLLRPAPATGALRGEAIHPPMRDFLDTPDARALAGESSTLEVQLVDVAGETRSLRINVAPRESGDAGVTGTVTSVYDITETLALDRSIRENEAQIVRINAITPSVMYILDVSQGHPVWAAGRIGTILGLTPEEFAAGAPTMRGRMICEEDRPLVVQRLYELAKLPDGEVRELEFRVNRVDGSMRWILDRAVVFERDAKGRVTKTLSAAIDIDDRKRAEERRTTLIHELNHRVKNTLAAVQSIARQTLRRGRPVEQAEEMFTARLLALSAAHDVLTRENWEGAGLREIVAGALRPFEAQGERRITAGGPEVRLGSRAALALAMALHELATNAAKYGALSGDAGEVRLVWQLREAGDDGVQLDLEWRERGGPPVRPPASTGFGSRLLTQGLAADLAGPAQLDFAPEGLVCRITAPIEATPRRDLP